jgi:para-aminobenzoate synthetase component 1
MISTVSGTWNENFSFIDLIENSFPMGSMTGAPKLKVMELIEQYEASRRELFSGTIGYIQPDSGFDFNVIIRSLFYNANTHYLSYQTGGAITYDSHPVQEWEETLLKAFNLEKIFQH